MKKLLQLLPMLGFSMLLFAQNNDLPKPGRNIQLPDTSIQGVNIYPNPTSGDVTITFKTIPIGTCILVLDKTAVQVYRQDHLSQNVIHINLGYLDTGIYTLVLISSNGYPVITKKFELIK